MKPLLKTMAGVLVSASCGIAAAQPVFPVARPDRADVTRYVTLPGTVRANQQATLYAKVPGYLKSLTVDRGDTVKAGQSLGEIEVPELAAELARYEAEFSIAKTDYARITEAKKKAPDLVVPQAIDEARGKLDIAKANIDRIETLLNYARLTAPFSGTVTGRYVDPGAFIPTPTGGSASQTGSIVTIMDFNTVRIQIAVPELEAVHVKNGQRVKFSTDVLPGRTFEATVSRFGYALDPMTQTMHVEADVPNADLTLRPGMFVTTRLGVETHKNVLRVPSDAVLVEKAGASVFVNGQGKARKTPVKTGFNDGAFVEIAEGVSESDAVIRFGKTPLADGQAVSVQP